MDPKSKKQPAPKAEGSSLEELTAMGAVPYSEEGVDFETLQRAGAVPHNADLTPATMAKGAEAMKQMPSVSDTVTSWLKSDEPAQMLRSWAQGRTYGLADKAASGLASMLPASMNREPYEVLYDALHPGEAKSYPAKSYDQLRAEDSALYNKAVADHPVANAAGAILAPAPGVKIAGGVAAKGAGLLQRAAVAGGHAALEGGVNGAIAGGLQAAGTNLDKASDGDLKGFGKDIEKGAAFGGATGALVSPVLRGGGALFQAGAKKYRSLKEKLLAERAGEFSEKFRSANDAYDNELNKKIDAKTRDLLKENEGSIDDAFLASDKSATDQERLHERIKNQLYNEYSKAGDRSAVDQEKLHEKVKNQIYNEYSKAITKAGVSPDQATKLLQANESQIKEQIDAEFRKQMYGTYAKQKKDLFTKIRNAEDLGANWTPEQNASTVAPAKSQYIEDASAVVDKGLPVPPSKLSPEEFKAEVMKRSRAAQAKALGKISDPPPSLDPQMLQDLAAKRIQSLEASGIQTPRTRPQPSLDPQMLNDLAAKRIQALEASGIQTPRTRPIVEAPAPLDPAEARRRAEQYIATLPPAYGGMQGGRPVLGPQPDPDMSLRSEGKEALLNAAGGAIKVGIGGAIGGHFGGTSGAAFGAGIAGGGNILTPTSHVMEGLRNPGAQYLMSGAQEKLAKVGSGLAAGAESLVPVWARSVDEDTAQSAKDKMQRLMALFGEKKEE